MTIERIDPPPGAAPPQAHAPTHQNGGSDEISVAGLSGLLADPQTPLAHVLADTTGLGPQHTTSGLSVGQVLRATGAGSAAFQALVAADLPVHDHTRHTDRTRLTTIPSPMLYPLSGAPVEVNSQSTHAWELANGVTSELAVTIGRPDEFISSTITLVVIWTTPAVDGANMAVQWSLRNFDHNIGDVAPVYTTLEVIARGSTGNHMINTLVQTVSLGTPGRREWRLVFRREGGDASDTISAVARIKALQLLYTADM